MKTVTCIVCPKGCTLSVDAHKGEVTGNGCSRGEQHAVAEILHPVRSLTSIVRVSNRRDTMVSVKSADPVPKEEMFAIMELIHAARVEAPIQIGDVLLDNVCGTKIIATKQIL